MPPASSTPCAISCSWPPPVLGMRIEWRGHGIDEVGVDARLGRTLVHVDPRHFRPTEVDLPAGRCDQGPTEAQLDSGDIVSGLWSLEMVANADSRCIDKSRRDGGRGHGYKIYKPHE